MKKVKLFFVVVSVLGMGNFGFLTAQAPVDQIDRPHLVKCSICGENFIYGCGHICKAKE